MIIFINDQSRKVNQYHFDIKDLPSNLTVPAAPKININTKTVMNVIFDYFSTLCKNFTIAMSLKYQVQDLLFNNDTTPELTILITFIIYLKY